MKIHANEISALIKEQIKNYRHKIDSNDVGTVVSVGDGIANVYGLEKAMLGELLLFPNNVYGMVMNLDSDSVGVVLLGNDSLVKEGDLVNRTKMVMDQLHPAALGFDDAPAHQGIARIDAQNDQKNRLAPYIFRVPW